MGKKRKARTTADPMLAATREMNRYCVAHPKGPAALKHPRLFIRDELWVALLGANAEEGVVGIGSTVEAALIAFDSEYLTGTRPKPPLPPQ